MSLVEKSHKHGNTYRVSPVLTRTSEQTEPRSTEIQSTSSLKTSQLVDRKTGISLPKSEQLVDRDSVILIDSKCEDERSLSPEWSAAWIEFTSRLTEKARERADKVFQSLKTQFPSDPVDELANCPRNLERFGAPDGTPWHQISSPIGLMESSWPQLREFFRRCIADSQKSDQAQQRSEIERIRADEQRRREAEETRLQREAFFTTFPDEQGRREIIQKYLAGLPFNPEGMIGQGIAIGKWWEDNKVTIEKCKS